jgi:hypothetical protein
LDVIAIIICGIPDLHITEPGNLIKRCHHGIWSSRILTRLLVAFGKAEKIEFLRYATILPLWSVNCEIGEKCLSENVRSNADFFYCSTHGASSAFEESLIACAFVILKFIDAVGCSKAISQVQLIFHIRLSIHGQFSGFWMSGSFSRPIVRMIFSL